MSCINITTAAAAAAAAASATTTTNSISSSSSSSHPHNPADLTLPPPPQQIPIINPSEQLCYVHCTLCDTVLVVSVPCASLFKTVTVRCGHCSNLLPVSMRALTLIHPHQQQQQLHFSPNLLAMAPTSNANTNTTTPTAPTPTHTPPSNFSEDINCSTTSAPSFSLNQQISNFVSTGNNSINTNIPLMVNDHLLPDPRLAVTPPQLVVNRPPEKRQRVPSAYNRFIKDEIQRIKAGNPDISHREAFSAAAKNWAHFPHIHFGLMPGHHAMRKTNMCPQVYANPQNQSQDGEDIITKDGLFASANFGILPY